MEKAHGEVEQRQLKRLPCCLDVSDGQKSAPVGVLQDLTLDGAFIVTEAPLPQGAVLPLVFSLGQAKAQIHADVEVVRPTSRGMGVRFLRMSGKDSRALRRFVVTLSDAVGARDSAQKLMDIDSRVTKPMMDANKISRLLTESGGLFYLLPAERAIRIEARLISQTAESLELECQDGKQLKDAEKFVCLYSFNFISYSFRSHITAVRGARFTIALPAEVCYSERRTGQRLESGPRSAVRFYLPWNPSIESVFQICETSDRGMSFKVPSENSPFEIGSTFPEMTIVRDGQQAKIYRAIVRHASAMVEDDGERWCRIGVSYNDQPGSQLESSESIINRDAPNKLVKNFVTMSRNVRSALSYVYHAKASKYTSAQDARGHTVIKFQNKHQQEIVGLLDTTFRPVDGCVRAPLLIVVPGFGARKETMSALAHTVVDNWKRQGRDIAVMRYDGTNNLGESYKDPGCEGEGKHGLHFNIPGGVEDVLSSLRWAKNNPYIDPTSVVVFSASMGSPAVRRALTMPECDLVAHWISFMGAADVASATLNGSGNIDIAGNYARNIKSGVISLIGCLFDADFSTHLAVKDKLMSLEDARVDMAKIKTNVTWFIGKHDAYIDPRNVRDIMSVSAPGKRHIIEVDAGHVPRHSEEALAEFSLIARHLWRIFYGKDLEAITPSRGWLSACAKREWDRVRKGLSTDAVSYWKDYLVGDNKIGFDAWSFTQEYQQLIADQTALVTASEPRRVLDLGAGTGNMSQALIRAGVSHVTAVDLVPEALERVEKKIDSPRLKIVAASADGGPLVAMRRWIEGDLGSLHMLSDRLPGDLKAPLMSFAASYNAHLHALLRGALLDAQLVTRQAGLPDSLSPVLQDLGQVSRMLRGLSGKSDTRSNIKSSVIHIVDGADGLPFESNHFDVVICSLVLSYMSFPDDTLFEIKRVVRPGGRLVISSMLPDMDSSKAFVRAVHFVESADAKDLPGHYDRKTLLEALREFADKSSKLVHLEEEGSFKFFSAAEMAQMLSAAGFENVQTRLSCGDPSLAVIATAEKAKGC